MIDYNCPNCGEAMSSPDSQAGQPERCPGCGNVCNIPERRSVVWIARVYDNVGATAKRVGGFCSRRRKLVGIVGANLILLTGLLSWFLPDWLPRPVVTFESPANVRTKAEEGLFPPRAELAKILKEHDYYPALSEPTSGILRGRHLWKYLYVKDINNPSWAYINVWCPLDDKERVLAISTRVSTPEIAKIGGAANGPDCEAIAFAHMRDGPAVVKALSSISVGANKQDFKETSMRQEGNQNILEASLYGNGFELEVISHFVASKSKGECLGIGLILKDKSWRYGTDFQTWYGANPPFFKILRRPMQTVGDFDNRRFVQALRQWSVPLDLFRNQQVRGSEFLLACWEALIAAARSVAVFYLFVLTSRLMQGR